MDQSESKKTLLFEYYEAKAIELTSRLNVAREFLSAHKLSAGMFGEVILRDFLSLHLPKSVKVSQGFVFSKGELSHQCDIIIYDVLKYSPLCQFGDIEIIPSEAVISVIEVKNTVSHKTFQKCLQDFKTLHNLGIWKKHILIFQAPALKKVEAYFYSKQLSNESIVSNDYFYDHGSKEELPNTITGIYLDSPGREGYFYEQDHVINDKDMMGYNAYRIITKDKGNSPKCISSLQLFLGTIYNEVCPDINPVQNETYREMKELELIDSFGLYDL